MSVESEINRISTNVSNTLSAIESKGVAVAADATSDDMAELVNSIPASVNEIITLTAEEFEALTTDEKAALYAQGVRVIAVDDDVDMAELTDKQRFADFVYPVGIVVELTVSTNPASLWGIGTWESYLPGRVLVGAGTADSGTVYEVGATGGEETHTLTVDEMPKHNHTAYGLGATTSPGTGGTYYEVMRSINRSNQYGTTTYVTEAGGSQPHNIMQPYGVVYRWLRTA